MIPHPLGLIVNSLKNPLNLAISSLVGLLSYYVFIVAQKPRLDSSNKKMLTFLQEHVPSVSQKFWPNLLFFEGRIQTMLAMPMRSRKGKKVPYKRQELTMADGGVVALDFLHPEVEDKPGSRLIVFVLPGITSASQTAYVQTMALSITKSGAIAAVLNNRGVGGLELRTPRMYSASNYDDMRECLHYLRKTYPSDTIIAVGTSLGGMVLSSYLSSQPQESKDLLSCALLISIVWDANKGMEWMETELFNRWVLNPGVAQGLVHLAKKHRKMFEDTTKDYDRVMKVRGVREFDILFTAPKFGWKDVEEYYDSATSNGKTHKYQIPVFGFGSEDDPMLPKEYIPFEEAQAVGSNLALITTKRGGHVAFVEGRPKSEHYLERFLFDFVTAVKAHGSSLRS